MQSNLFLRKKIQNFIMSIEKVEKIEKFETCNVKKVKKKWKIAYDLSKKFNLCK